MSVNTRPVDNRQQCSGYSSSVCNRPQNVGSLNNYRSLSDNHKMAISKILSRTDSSARNLALPSTLSSKDLNPVQYRSAQPFPREVDPYKRVGISGPTAKSR